MIQIKSSLGLISHTRINVYVRLYVSVANFNLFASQTDPSKSHATTLPYPKSSLVPLIATYLRIHARVYEMMDMAELWN